MYEDKRFLTAKEILEKEFKIDARGYRPQEVDQFLDMIIKDYVDFETTTKRLVTEIKTLEAENAKVQSLCIFLISSGSSPKIEYIVQMSRCI